jgi:hypothetical protein
VQAFTKRKYIADADSSASPILQKIKNKLREKNNISQLKAHCKKLLNCPP